MRPDTGHSAHRLQQLLSPGRNTQQTPVPEEHWITLQKAGSNRGTIASFKHQKLHIRTREVTLWLQHFAHILHRELERVAAFHVGLPDAALQQVACRASHAS